MSTEDEIPLRYTLARIELLAHILMMEEYVVAYFQKRCPKAMGIGRSVLLV
jgi:hypothetical protein